MYPAPVLPQGKEKPSLQGVRNKQRKGVQKATAKFEPLVFRDQLVKHLESVPPGDFEAVAAKLDALGNQLDYRKYEQQLFEILLAGGLLNPGGGYVEDGTPRSTFSVLGSSQYPVDLGEMKKIVDVFNKLLRRYKYLQKPFEDTSVRGILQYANKFDEQEREKLAAATAVFVQADLVPAAVLTVLKKEHLIKNNISINLFTTFCKTYLVSESLEHLASDLRKGAVTDLEGFFPLNHQTPAALSTHLKAAGLGGVADFYNKQKSGQAKEDTLNRLKELVAEDADHDDILSFLEQQHKRAALLDTDFIAIVWQGLFGTVEADKASDALFQDIKDSYDIFEVFCTKPSIEVALINTMQLWTFENTTHTSLFPKILKTMYGADVLSDQSIIYWHSKGAKPQGKAQFLAATQPLVTFLQEQEDESDEE